MQGKTALVLGAGGIAGTSAGAVIAAVLAAGHDPHGLLRFAEEPDSLAEAIALAVGERGPEGLAPRRRALGDAGAASCAVPAYYRPVPVNGRLYVDGGLRSVTNADQLVGERCDTVWILSPFSTRERGALLDTALLGAARALTARQIEREADLLREDGATVHVIGPTADDIRVMGVNPMERAHSRDVLETAFASVTAQLREPILA